MLFYNETADLFMYTCIWLKCHYTIHGYTENEKMKKILL